MCCGGGIDEEPIKTYIVTYKKQQDNFAMFDVSSAATTELDDTHDLHVMVQQFMTKMTRYDVLDVFTIVFPDKNAQGEQTGTLSGPQ